MILNSNTILRRVLALLVCSLTLLTADRAPAAKSGWIVPARYLPVPTDISPQLYEILSELRRPNVERAKSDYPKTKAEWKELVGSQRGNMAGYMHYYAKEMSVKISKEKIAGVPVYRITPDTITPEHRKHLFLYIHGGAYVFGSGEAGLPEAIMIAHRIGIPVLSVDYRTAPKDPYPAAIEDMVAVYRSLLKTQPADSIALGGTSSGGGLALAAIHKYKRLGLPLPGALYAGTPWSDLSKTGDSYTINEGIDHKLIAYDGFIEAAAKLYANGSNLKDPLLSPVYGSFKNFPPTYLVTGTRDLFLSNTIRVHRKLREVGVEADLNVYEGFSHVEYLVAKDSPEAKEIYRELGIFLRRHLSR